MFHEDELKHYTEGDSSMKMPFMFARTYMKVNEHGAMTMMDDTRTNFCHLIQDIFQLMFCLFIDEHQGDDSTMKDGDEMTIITANHPFAFAMVNEYGRIFHLGRVMCPH